MRTKQGINDLIKGIILEGNINITNLQVVADRIIEALIEENNLFIPDVSQQRELLKAFSEQLRPALEIDIGFDYITDEDIEECLKAFNCG